jgi:hypothetical protein
MAELVKKIGADRHSELRLAGTRHGKTASPRVLAGDLPHKYRYEQIAIEAGLIVPDLNTLLTDVQINGVMPSLRIYRRR